MADKDRTRLGSQDRFMSATLRGSSTPLSSPSRVAAETACASTVEPGLVLSISSSRQSSKSSLLDSEALPKYRLNRNSFARDLRSVRTHNEPSLTEILELERNAWLDDTDLRTQQHCEDADAAQDATNVGESSDCRPRLTSASTSRPKQRSYFQEGSMNESSKAVASTWQFLAEYKDDCDSDLSSSDTTPRASATSRASTCSSIDINEFKPLPATPSTFRNTIKRLGQKVVHTKPSFTALTPAAVAKPEIKVKRGLRRSISTWKIFSNPLSDCEGNSRPSMDDESPNKKKANIPSRARNLTAQFDSALPPKSILDERKRKAELAYSQQFGTMRKRPKHTDTTDSGDAQLSERKASAQTTVRIRDFPAPPVTRVVRSRSHEPDNITSISSTTESHSTEPSDSAGPGKRATFTRHNRSHSYDPDLCSYSQTDHLKKQSRRELEKENQRLRLMLKGKGGKETVKDHANISHEYVGLDLPVSRRQTASRSTIDASAGRVIQEMCASLANSVTQPTAAVHNVENRSTSTYSWKTEHSSDIDESDGPADIPPITYLPSSLHQRAPLSAASGNVQWHKETSTVKRRAPVSNAISQVGLPRPLSMVLEGIEGSGEEGHGILTTDSNFNGTADGASHGGEGFPSSQPSRHHNADSQKWTWPEDVF